MLSFPPRTEEWLLRNLDFNPAIARRDIRARNRRANPWAVGVVYLGALFGLACLPLLIGKTPRLSRDAFGFFVHGQTVVIVILMAGSAASVTAREREKGTEDALRMTRLTSTDIIAGALIGLLDQPLLLIVASVPFAMWAVVLGEVSVLQVILCLSLTLATVAVVGALVLTNQTRMSTIGATVAAYVGVAVFYRDAFVLLIQSTMYHRADDVIGTWTALFWVGIAWTGLGSVTVSVMNWVLAHRGKGHETANSVRARHQTVLWVLGALLAVLLLCVGRVASMPRRELAVISPHMAVQSILSDDGPLWDAGQQGPDRTGPVWPAEVKAWAISMISLLLLTHVLCRIAVAAHKKRNRREAETVNIPRG